MSFKKCGLVAQYNAKGISVLGSAAQRDLMSSPPTSRPNELPGNILTCGSLGNNEWLRETSSSPHHDRHALVLARNAIQNDAKLDKARLVT